MGEYVDDGPAFSFPFPFSPFLLLSFIEVFLGVVLYTRVRKKDRSVVRCATGSKRR